MRKGPFSFSESLSEFLPKNTIVMARRAALGTPALGLGLKEQGSRPESLSGSASSSDGASWRVGLIQGTPGGQGILFAGERLCGDPAALVLLHKMIEALGIRPDEVQIADLLSPVTEGVSAGRSFGAEVLASRPRAVVAMGASFGAFLGVKRGEWGSFEGARVLATHHPMDLLQSPEMKKQAWADLQELARQLGIRLPARKS